MLNNKIYFGSDDGNFYEYDPLTNQQKVVITTDAFVESSGVVLNNKVYFGSGDHNVYEYDPLTNQQKVVITTNNFVKSSGVVLNNKVYFGSDDGNVYEYNPLTNQQKVVITTNAFVDSSGVVLNNKVYFGSGDHKVYECLPLELYDYNIINMEKIVKLGIYVIQLKQNSNFNIENISNINLEGLTVSDISLKQKENGYKAFIKNEKLENVCQNISATFTNNSNIEQTQSTASCSEKIVETNTFQKLNGFSKTETKSDSTTTGTSNSKADKKAWSWNWNAKVGVKTKAKVGLPLVAEGEVELSGEIGGGETRGEDTTYTNSENEGKTLTFNVGDISNSADTQIHTNTKDITITIPSQPVKIPPHNTYSIDVKSNKEITEFTLSLNQKIYGKISATIIEENYNKLIDISIKDIMSALQENNLLTEKITINNNDSSVNFVYDVKITKEAIKIQTIIE
ncbi:hypothetical protein [Spiroplasma poulsonii]|uniref:Toxin n=1 Tax=Spiroplasma poulsonii TaxID=2138 RepID=A0A2P6FFL8_9MOLU|nr:hypothetical protein [Spiroplasma poulsonii]KAF0850080.1 toxin [Spiroplasma poulsonii]PQM32257.1 toxin [Spiroplasma poulsonii]PWF94908.1 hypothetical protein SMSE_03320 [Spiroplasma poulsonii]PWF97703.1 hypothetical protein SMH99_02520 [Spiroplasma poulsonii]